MWILEIQRSLIKSLLLVFFCAKQPHEQCGSCKYSCDRIHFLMMWLLRKLQESQKKWKSAICLFKLKNANRWFAFLLCFLNLFQEAQGVTIGKRCADKKVEDIPAPDQYEARSTLIEGPQKWLYIHNPQ